MSVLSKVCTAQASLRDRAIADSIRCNNADNGIILAAKRETAPATHTGRIFKWRKLGVDNRRNERPRGHGKNAAGLERYSRNNWIDQLVGRAEYNIAGDIFPPEALSKIVFI